MRRIVRVVVGALLHSLLACVCEGMVWGDIRGPPRLKAVDAPPKHALTAATTQTQGYVVREKLFSISGEDFTIETEEGRAAFDVVGSNKVPFGIGGFVLDKLELYEAASAAKKLCGSIERRAVAMATAYDVYDSRGTCVCKIERDVVSLTPSYKFFYEAENDGNPHYRACGSFSQRCYDVYGRDGSEVATIGRQLFELLPDTMDTYHVRCAKGVDPAAILALALVIDEDHDETDAKRERDAAEDDTGGKLFGLF